MHPDLVASERAAGGGLGSGSLRTRYVVLREVPGDRQLEYVTSSTGRCAGSALSFEPYPAPSSAGDRIANVTRPVAGVTLARFPNAYVTPTLTGPSVARSPLESAPASGAFHVGCVSAQVGFAGANFLIVPPVTVEPLRV